MSIIAEYIIVSQSGSRQIKLIKNIFSFGGGGENEKGEVFEVLQAAITQRTLRILSEVEVEADRL
jgi:hypothetical protein